MKQEHTQSNHKNLTYQDRLNIEERLKAGSTFKAIADELGRHARTISREVQRGNFKREES